MRLLPVTRAEMRANFVSSTSTTPAKAALLAAGRGPAADAGGGCSFGAARASVLPTGIAPTSRRKIIVRLDMDTSFKNTNRLVGTMQQPEVHCLRSYFSFRVQGRTQVAFPQ